MAKATATAIFGTDLASAEPAGAAAPEWVEMFPAGPEIAARDGRRWTADADAVIAAFVANNGPLPIDYEHGQDILAERGEAAPAAGWIVELQNRLGAVWARVEWTVRAAAMIAAREYRFISPAFNTTKDGRITRLLGAGLVNRPAIEMKALSRNQPHNQEISMKAIAKALGLDEGVAEAAILAAIDAGAAEHKALASALKLDPTNADQAAITAAIAKLQGDLDTALAALAAAPDKAEMAAVRQSLADTAAALAAIQKKDADRDIDAALDAAQAAGKITPASRDTYRAMCAVDGGLDRFRALASTLPVICEPSKLDGGKATTEDGGDVDPIQLAARARKHQEEQAAAGRQIDIATAVVEAKEMKQ